MHKEMPIARSARQHRCAEAAMEAPASSSGVKKQTLLEHVSERRCSGLPDMMGGAGWTSGGVMLGRQSG